MRNIINKLNFGRIDAAFIRARSRINGQSQFIAISAILVFFSFLLLAFLAPFAIKMPRILQIIFGFLPFLLLMFGVGFAIYTLIKLGKEDTNPNLSLQFSGTIAKTAIDVALSEAEEAGLKSIGSREYGDCLSGKIGEFPFAIIKGIGQTFSVIRLKRQANCFIMMTPNGLSWPNKLPTDMKLTPLTLPLNLDAQAWTYDNLPEREKAQSQFSKMEQTLIMSKNGGELPFLYLNGRSLILTWQNCDIGSACLITHEIAKSML